MEQKCLCVLDYSKEMISLGKCINKKCECKCDLHSIITKFLNLLII
jgi:hypothetical protein